MINPLLQAMRPGELGADSSLKIDVEMKDGAELFAHLKQLFKLYLRQRDKAMMLAIIEEVGLSNQSLDLTY